MPHISHAGWSQCDITPPLGLPMGGRGARFSPADHILDPLIGQAIILKDAQDRQLVLISVDLIELSSPQSDQIAYMVAGVLGLSPESVVINASHTHSGPMMGIRRYATSQPTPPELEAYFHWLVDALVKLAVQAAKNLMPATITWRQGQTDIGINRRRLVDGSIHLAPNPQGAYDRSLWVLDVQAIDQPEKRAILFAHGCHPVMVYGFAWTALSAEWPGQARQAMGRELGETTHCQFFQGLAGNIRPRILGDLASGTFRKATPGDVAAVGGKIAGDVLSTLSTPGQSLELKLASTRDWFSARRENNLPPASHWEKLLASEHEHERESGKYWLSRYADDAVPPFTATPWPVGVIQLTPEHLIAWFGGEPVAEWRDILLAALPGRHLAMWGYTHDCVGYLATDALLPQGGYEVTYAWLGNQSPTRFKPGLDDAAVTVFRKLAARLAVDA